MQGPLLDTEIFSRRERLSSTGVERFKKFTAVTEHVFFVAMQFQRSTGTQQLNFD